MPVEWGKIREYAVATGSASPDYLDNPNAPIPPTFLSTVIFWDQPGGGLRTPEAVAAMAEVGLEEDIRNVLSAEQEYRFHGPLPRAGDRLGLTHRFDGVEIKEGRRGGQMVFTRFTVEFRDPDTTEIRAECLYTSVRTSRAATEGSA
jgi:MaoC dehydratase-like protein